MLFYEIHNKLHEKNAIYCKKCILLQKVHFFSANNFYTRVFFQTHLKIMRFSIRFSNVLENINHTTGYRSFQGRRLRWQLLEVVPR